MDKFRPIALCNVIYKILSKILANRIKHLLNELINQSQSSFLAGRNIHDNILIFNELAYTISKSQMPLTLLKLDISKANDRIYWSTICHTLSNMCIPKQSMDWIYACISSSFSYLINEVQSV